MKRRIMAWFALVLLVVGMVAAPQLATAASFTAAKAAIKVGSTTIKVGATSTGWKSKLGKYSRKAYDGCTEGTQSYLYTFSGKGVKVETLLKTKTNKETVMSFVITGKTVGTSTGLKVGNTKERMETLYGTGYSKSSSTYTYSAGGKSMVVKFSGDKVKSITLLA